MFDFDLCNAHFSTVRWVLGPLLPPLVADYIARREDWIVEAAGLDCFVCFLASREGEDCSTTRARRRASVKVLCITLVYGGSIRGFVREEVTELCRRHRAGSSSRPVSCSAARPYGACVAAVSRCIGLVSQLLFDFCGASCGGPRQVGPM